MATWKKTLIAGLAATIIGAGATGAALASSERHSGNDRRIDTGRPTVLDSHGTGISDDGARIGNQKETPEPGETPEPRETPEPGEDNQDESEQGDDNQHDSNSNSGSSDNRDPSENSGPGEGNGDSGLDDGGNHGDNSGPEDR